MHMTISYYNYISISALADSIELQCVASTYAIRNLYLMLLHS